MFDGLWCRSNCRVTGYRDAGNYCRVPKFIFGNRLAAATCVRHRTMKQLRLLRNRRREIAIPSGRFWAFATNHLRRLPLPVVTPTRIFGPAPRRKSRTRAIYATRARILLLYVIMALCARRFLNAARHDFSLPGASE